MSSVERLAHQIGRTSHIVYEAGEPRCVRTEEIGMYVNGARLCENDLYNFRMVDYRGNSFSAQRHADGIYLPDVKTVIPISALIYSHDMARLLQAHRAGKLPDADTMLDLLNREAVERLHPSH